MKNVLSLACLTVGTLILSGSAHAVQVTKIDGSQGWFNLPANGGSASVSATPTFDGDGSLVQSTPGSSGVSQLLYMTGTPLGTLGDIKDGTIRFDFFKDPSSTNTVNNIAFKLYLNSSFTHSLTWEAAYNGGAAAAGTWNNDRMVGDEGWWLRSTATPGGGRVNFDQASNVHDLNWWAANGQVTDGTNTSITLNDSTVIYGYGFQAGSGWSGTFTSAVDDLVIDYTGTGTDYSANFQVVPEPASMLALGGAVVALLRRRRKQA